MCVSVPVSSIFFLLFSQFLNKRWRFGAPTAVRCPCRCTSSPTPPLFMHSSPYTLPLPCKNSPESTQFVPKTHPRHLSPHVFQARSFFVLQTRCYMLLAANRNSPSPQQGYRAYSSAQQAAKNLVKLPKTLTTRLSFLTLFPNLPSLGEAAPVYPKGAVRRHAP